MLRDRFELEKQQGSCFDHPSVFSFYVGNLSRGVLKRLAAQYRAPQGTEG
jgi:hypothetical protein